MKTESVFPTGAVSGGFGLSKREYVAAKMMNAILAGIATNDKNLTAFMADSNFVLRQQYIENSLVCADLLLDALVPKVTG